MSGDPTDSTNRGVSEAQTAAAAAAPPQPISAQPAAPQPQTRSATRAAAQSQTGASQAVTGSQAISRTDADGPVQAKIKKSRGKLFLFLGVTVLVFAAGGAIWWLLAQGHEETDDSYVDGHITTISSRVSGVVTQVLVEDNQMVKAGQPLLRLDARDFQARVDKFIAAKNAAEQRSKASKSKIGQSSLSAQGQATQAKGSIDRAGADIEHAKEALLAAKADERQAAAHVTEQEAELSYRQSDFERYKVVYASKAVTKQQYDRAAAALDVSKAQLRQAQDSLENSKRKVMQAEADIKDAVARQLTSQGQYTSAIAAEKQTDIDTSQYESELASIEQAKSDLEEAELQLSYTKIDAPMAGRIGKRTVEVGQRIEGGQALMAVVQPNPWVTANFKETQLSKMKVGQEAEIKIDAFPGKVFKGHVDSLSPASGAKFSVLPPDNASGNFTKVVQRIPVKITIDPDSVGAYGPRITPGMSCITTINFK